MALELQWAEKLPRMVQWEALEPPWGVELQQRWEDLDSPLTSNRNHMLRTCFSSPSLVVLQAEEWGEEVWKRS